MSFILCPPFLTHIIGMLAPINCVFINIMAVVKKPTVPSLRNLTSYSPRMPRLLQSVLVRVVCIALLGFVLSLTKVSLALCLVSHHNKLTDLAHTIRNQTTKFFHAVASLSAKIRWCLTGTPIQNQLEDLGALVRFLRVPFVSTPQEFRKNFVLPIEAGSSRGFENLRTLLKCICIRRTKDLLRLPDHQVVQYELQLSPAEKSRYSQILASHKKAIDDTVCGRKPSEAYRTIFQALLKLRMLCNHGTFQTDDHDGTDKTLAILQEGTASCAYCSEDIISDGAKEDSVAGQLPACSHVVCQGCIRQYEDDLERLNEGFEVACPLCKIPLEEDLERSKIGTAVFGPQICHLEDGTSTKLSKLLEDVKKHRFTEKWYVLPDIHHLQRHLVESRLNNYILALYFPFGRKLSILSPCSSQIRISALYN